MFFPLIIKVSFREKYIILPLTSKKIVLEGGMRGGWEEGPRGRGYIYTHIYLTHFIVQQKLKQHFKAIVFQVLEF